MNILVTGGAGFIGSHLCDALIARGDRVVVMDNLILGRVANIQHLMDNTCFRFVQADILDRSALDQVFVEERIEEVYHLAANSDIQKGGRDASVDCTLTFMTTFEVLQCMRRHGVKRLVFTSSSAIYGGIDKALTEDTGPLAPASMYGAAKLASEAFISAFTQSGDLESWIVRFPNVVGERATHGVILDFINKLRSHSAKLTVLGDGRQYKPYMYVRDLVEAILFVREHADETFNVFNVGVESRSRVSDIAHAVIGGMGLQADIEYTGGSQGWVGDVPAYRYDLEKLKRLGWVAPRSSDEAVQLAITRILDAG